MGADGAADRRDRYRLIFSRRLPVSDLWIIAAIVVGWLVLSLWVLPKLGVSS
jgi:hypothetical protein